MAKNNMSSARIQEHLRGVDYPADKRELLQRARSNGADNQVIEALNSLPERQYQSSAQVTEELNGRG